MSAEEQVWASQKDLQFVLIGRDGTVKWIQDYGAAKNGGRVYVSVQELVPEIQPRLG